MNDLLKDRLVPGRVCDPQSKAEITASLHTAQPLG